VFGSVYHIQDSFGVLDKKFRIYTLVTPIKSQQTRLDPIRVKKIKPIPDPFIFMSCWVGSGQELTPLILLKFCAKLVS
jgi:hypothetical protein